MTSQSLMAHEKIDIIASEINRENEKDFCQTQNVFNLKKRCRIREYLRLGNENE